MNRLVRCLAAILGVTFIFFCRSASGGREPEVKHADVPMPKGLVRAEALDIVKDWKPPVVHLQGNATVRIYTATKAPRGAVTLHADAVDLDQTTGEITPRGNVHLTIEEMK
jgi:lipopolysaccharide assembly outer membrane protein LptD (OstA)